MRIPIAKFALVVAVIALGFAESSSARPACEVEARPGVNSSDVVRVGVKCRYKVDEFRISLNGIDFVPFRKAWSHGRGRKGKCSWESRRKGWVKCSGLSRLNEDRKRKIWFAGKVGPERCVGPMAITVNGGRRCSGICYGDGISSMVRVRMPDCGE